MSKAPGATSNPLLVVDDDEMNRDMLSRRLRRRGYQVEVAADGHEALRMIETTEYDLVLLDIMMPGIDGLEVLERIRRGHEMARLPVIMATAKDQSDDVVRALRLGANDYVTKPLDFQVVLARVRTQLSLRQARRQLEAANTRMRLDLEAAAKVQQSLMPATLPELPSARFAWKFLPCDELAGDILDVFWLDDDKIGMYLLDVSGHGVPAALLSVTLNRVLPHLEEASLLVEEALHQGDSVLLSPAHVAQRLNVRFPMDPNTSQYFTIVYGVLDSARLELTYVSAAHPGPIHLRADGTSELHPPTGLAIGWFPKAHWEDTKLQLAPGDRIYLCSDGLNEAMNGDDEMFGYDRMIDCLERSRDLDLQASIERLLEAVHAWTGSETRDDDMSVVALEIPASA